MSKQTKNENKEPRAYTNEELEAMIKSSERKLKMAKSTLDTIVAYGSRVEKEYFELLEQKKHLEQELSKYSGAFAEIKHALKAAFSGKDNEAKIRQKELGDELKTLQRMIDESLSELQSIDYSISAKEEKIQGYQRDINRWNAKLRKREANGSYEPENSPGEPTAN